MKMKRLLLFSVMGIILGIGVAGYRLLNIENSPAFFHNGNWIGTTHLPLGNDALITAQVTLFAMYALPSNEAVYLMSRRDSDGNRFHGSKQYIISGNLADIKARYWSITVYGKDLYLIPNRAERYSFNNTNIVADSAGNFSIMLSSDEQKGNWLPTPDKAEFNLLLRIYNGDSAFLKQLSVTPLPQVKRNKP